MDIPKSGMTDFVNAYYGILCALIFLFFCGCNDFMTETVVFGGARQQKTTDEADDDGSDESVSDSARDDDADGLSNGVERSIASNPNIADTDQDGYADGFELVNNAGDPLNARAVPAPLGDRAFQSAVEVVFNDPDTDEDGLGKSFETEEGTNPDLADSDGDGYSDALELIADSDPLDSEDRPSRFRPPESDGQVRSGTSPSDIDRDGLSAEIEELRGTNPQTRDTDRDGFADGVEVIMGSDGSDAQSIPDFSADNRGS